MENRLQKMKDFENLRGKLQEKVGKWVTIDENHEKIGENYRKFCKNLI